MYVSNDKSKLKKLKKKARLVFLRKSYNKQKILMEMYKYKTQIFVKRKVFFNTYFKLLF